MQFTTFVTAALVAVVGASAASINGQSQDQNLQKRFDNRQLYKFQGGDGAAACRNWKCACVNYQPQDQSLEFRNTYCQPGDYQGQNKNSEALALCTFASSDGKTVKQINMHTAATAGFTLVQN